MIGLAPFEFRTECHPKQPLPYQLDLDGAYDVGSEKVVPCVDIIKVGTNSNNSYPKILTSADGNQLMFSSQKDYTEHQTLIFPEMERPVSELSLEMAVGASPYGAACLLEVGVVKSVDDMESFQLLRTISLPKNGFEIYNLYFSRFTDEYKNIVVRTPLDTVSQVYVLAAAVTVIDGCAEMSEVSLSDVQPDKATLTWIGDVESKWDVVVSKTQQTVENLGTIIASPGQVDAAVVPFAQTVESNPCTVTGLTPHTPYYFYVRSKCSSEGGPWTDGFLFRTNCGMLTADNLGVEGFESYAVGDTTLCWSGRSQKSAIPEVTDGNVHDGERSLRISSGVMSDVTTEAVFYSSSAIDTAASHNTINKYQVSFWGYAPFNPGENKGRLDVGVSFALDDASTFAGVDSVYNYGVWHYYTIPFDTYVGDADDIMGQYVTINSGFDEPNEFYIDEMKVEVAPECLAPRRISLSDIDDRGAVLHWYADMNDVVIRICDHQLSHDEISLSEIEGVTEIPVSGEQEYKLENMAPRSRFYIYVGAECDGVMKWSSPVSFETACPATFSIPYNESFDNAGGTGSNFKPDCWRTFHSVREQDQRHNQFPSIESGGKKGNCLRFFTNNATQVSYAIMQKFGVDVSAYQMTFFARFSGSSATNALEIGVVKDKDAKYDEITKDAQDGGFTPIDTVVVTTEYKKYYVSLASYKPEYGDYLAFRVNYNLGGRSTYVYLDELTIDVTPDCLQPEELNFVSVSDNSIEFELVEVGGSTAWEYACIARGTQPADTDAKPIQTSKYKITDLAFATDYDIYVRSVNAEGKKSSWTGPLTQRTYTSYITDYETPYIESFEDEVGAWHLLDAADANNWCIGTAAASDGTKGLYISSDRGTTASADATLPSVSYAYRTVYMPSGVYYVSYKWNGVGGSSSDHVKVGLIDADAMFDAGSSNVFYADGTTTSLASALIPTMKSSSLTESEGWSTDTVMHVVYVKDEGYYNLLFYWQNAGSATARPLSAAIDRVEISKVPCVYPMELKYDAVDHESVTLSWSLLDDSENRKYEIFVTADASISDPTGHLDLNINKGGLVSDLTHRVTGLSAESTYYAFVRSVCDDGKYYSIWSDRVSFTTPCAPVAPGILYSFEQELDDCFSTAGYGNKFGRKENDGYGTYARIYFSTLISSRAGAQVWLLHCRKWQARSTITS